MCVCCRYSRITKKRKGTQKVEGMSSSSGASKQYIDLIWRRPELMKLFFAAGVESVLSIDSDGIFFNEVLVEDEKMIHAAGEFASGESYQLTKASCARAPLFRKAPLIMNGGTTFVPNSKMGNNFLDAWLHFRGTMATGFCSNLYSESELSSVLNVNVMLDQDGLNAVACTDVFVSLFPVQVFSSNQVLLNSIHSTFRSNPAYSICKPWFFHATNCGSTAEKHQCLTRNEVRRKEAKCN